MQNNRKYTNWLQSETFQPSHVIRPLHVEDLVQAVKLAAADNLKVRVRGCGTTNHASCHTPHLLVDITSLNKPVKIDTVNHTVEVEAGMIVRDLNEYLQRHDLALSVQGEYQDVTIGGCILTGNHGTGVNYGIMASYVTSMTLVTASGEVKVVSREADSDIYYCVPGSLGMLGILATLTIQCEPMYKLHLVVTSDPYEKVLIYLDKEIRESEHFEFNYCPRVEGAQVKHYKRTAKESADLSVAKPRKRFGSALGGGLSEFCYLISSAIPSVARAACRLERYTFSDIAFENIGPGFRISTIEKPAKMLNNEWAFPIEHTRDALEDINEWVMQHKFPVHNGIHVRFSCRDDFYLSPAYKRDICWIRISTHLPFGKKIDHSTFHKAVATIMMKYDGRPHWAMMLLESGDYNFYFPEWKKFLQIRNKLDAGGLFINDFLRNGLCLGLDDNSNIHL